MGYVTGQRNGGLGYTKEGCGTLEVSAGLGLEVLGPGLGERLRDVGPVEEGGEAETRFCRLSKRLQDLLSPVVVVSVEWTAR